MNQQWGDLMYRWFGCALLTGGLLAGCASPNEPNIPSESQLVLISQTQTLGWAQVIRVEGDTAYVADGEQGVTIWDISNLNAPHVIDTLRTQASVKMVQFAPGNRILFVVEDVNNAGVTGYLLDTGQRLINIGSTGVYAFRIIHDVQDTFTVLYTDVSDKYVRFVEMTNDPLLGWGEEQIGSYSSRAPFRGFDLAGDYIYLAHSQFGMQIANLNRATGAIAPLGSVDTPGSGYDLSVNEDGTIAVVADFHDGIQIIDVTDVDNPQIKTGFLAERVKRVFKVEVVGDIAYFLDMYNGLFAADIAQPENPRLLSYYKMSYPTGMFVSDDHTIFLTDEDLGLLILRWS